MPFRKKRIIVADRSQTFAMYISVLLKRMGFDVVPAKNGPDVVTFATELEPDMVLLDLNIPMLDGIETVERLKGDSRTSGIPVVMVSLDGRKEIREECKEIGCAGFLVKPIKLEELHNLFEETIFHARKRKRRGPRVPYNGKVVVRHGGKDYGLYAENISASGIYVRMAEPIEVGEAVDVLIPLGKERLVLKGKVVYMKGLYGDVFKVPPGIAIEFQNMTVEAKRHLEDFVKELLAGDIVDSQEEPTIELG